MKSLYVVPEHLHPSNERHAKPNWHEAESFCMLPAAVRIISSVAVSLTFPHMFVLDHFLLYVDSLCTLKRSSVSVSWNSTVYLIVNTRCCLTNLPGKHLVET